MTQRKLTDDELQKVMTAKHDIKQMCSWDDTDRGREYWQGVYNQLHLMAFHGTTDGQPYVEPQPPIPDGYRKAVAGDEGRRDCKIWCLREWHTRDMLQFGKPFCDQSIYIVPIDRTPTDEDARSRPVVMVRDCDGQKWHKHILILVRYCEHSKYKFATTDTERAEIVCWKQARHLYPGE